MSRSTPARVGRCNNSSSSNGRFTIVAIMRALWTKPFDGDRSWGDAAWRWRLGGLIRSLARSICRRYSHFKLTLSRLTLLLNQLINLIKKGFWRWYDACYDVKEVFASSIQYLQYPYPKYYRQHVNYQLVFDSLRGLPVMLCFCIPGGFVILGNNEYLNLKVSLN